MEQIQEKALEILKEKWINVYDYLNQKMNELHPSNQNTDKSESVKPKNKKKKTNNNSSNFDECIEGEHSDNDDIEPSTNFVKKISKPQVFRSFLEHLEKFDELLVKYNDHSSDEPDDNDSIELNDNCVNDFSDTDDDDDDDKGNDNISKKRKTSENKKKKKKKKKKSLIILI